VAELDAPSTITVSGAVSNPGRYVVHPPRTINRALAAAGGLEQRPNRWPAGPITVRRPRGPGKVDVWRFDIQSPAEWCDFPLEPGDLVVFQWHIYE
jgi:protein involved in polysaccharide export with SLBB domain